MLPRWQMLAERWPTSAGQTVSRPVRMHSSQFVLWSPTGLDALGVLAQRLGKRLFRRALEHAPADEDRALGPLEHAVGPRSVALELVVDHADAVGVDEHQPRALLRILRRDHLDRPAAVHAERPLGDVEVVRAHVGQRRRRRTPDTSARPGSPCGCPWDRAPRCSRGRGPARATCPSRSRPGPHAWAGRTARPARRRRCGPS